MFICVLALITLETGALSLGCWLLISRTSFQIICKFHHPLVICRLSTRYVMLFHPDISDFFSEHANQDCTAYLSLADTYCKICGRQINNSSLNSLFDFCSGMLKHQTLVLVTFLSRNTFTQTVMIFFNFFYFHFTSVPCDYSIIYHSNTPQGQVFWFCIAWLEQFSGLHWVSFDLLSDWSRNSCHLLNQSDAKLKPITTWLPAFSSILIFLWVLIGS